MMNVKPLLLLLYCAIKGMGDELVAYVKEWIAKRAFEQTHEEAAIEGTPLVLSAWYDEYEDEIRLDNITSFEETRGWGSVVFEAAKRLALESGIQVIFQNVINLRVARALLNGDCTCVRLEISSDGVEADFVFPPKYHLVFEKITDLAMDAVDAFIDVEFE